MHSRPLVISAASAITPARCGSSRSKLIPCWHDKHSLTCDNDTADSWDNGWTRQPPIYQESLLFPAQHASHLPEQTQIVPHAVHCHRGLVTITKYGSDPIFRRCRQRAAFGFTGKEWGGPPKNMP